MWASSPCRCVTCRGTSSSWARRRVRNEVEIRARVNGFLEQRDLAEGSLVKAGDVMYSAWTEAIQAALSAANAELAQQQARLTTARANLNRVRPLAAKNALSQKDLNNSTGQEQAAAAAVEQAKASVVSAKLNLKLYHHHFARERAVQLRQEAGGLLYRPHQQPADLRGQAGPNVGELQPFRERSAANALTSRHRARSDARARRACR